jgi:hypothetical protein
MNMQKSENPTGEWGDFFLPQKSYQNTVGEKNPDRIKNPIELILCNVCKEKISYINIRKINSP